MNSSSKHFLFRKFSLQATEANNIMGWDDQLLNVQTLMDPWMKQVSLHYDSRTLQYIVLVEYISLFSPLLK